MAVIGNFPYNISSQIVFKILDNRAHVPWVVGMFQKEVAYRLAAKYGSKVYGVTSALTQAYYEVFCLINPVYGTFLRIDKRCHDCVDLFHKTNDNDPRSVGR